MTKTRKFIIGTLLSVVTLSAFVSYASPFEHFGKFRGMDGKRIDFIINRASSRLDLNAIQKQNLIAIKDTIKQQRALHQNQNPHDELVKLLSVPVLDEAKVLSLVEIRTTQLHLAAPAVVSAIADFTNSLNDKQRAEIIKVADKIAEHRKNRFSRHGKASYDVFKSNN